MLNERRMWVYSEVDSDVVLACCCRSAVSNAQRDLCIIKVAGYKAKDTSKQNAVH